MRKVLFVLIFAAIAATSAFAQRVGDAWSVGNETWVVQSISGDTMTMKKAPGLDGVWQYGRVGGSGGVHTVRGNSGVYTKLDTGWQDAAAKGIVKVGDPVLRNIKKTGALTWTAEANNLVRGEMKWADITITLAADGNTLRFSGGYNGSWNRVQ